MKALKKPYRFGFIYGTLLFLLFAYVMLDTLVIPRQLKSANISVDDNIYATADKTPVPTGNVNDTVITDRSYSDGNISININKLREYDTDIYAVSVKLKSVVYLKSAFANGKYGKNIKETTSDMAEDNNAILAINGDYYGFRTRGFVIRNGIMYRDITNENDGIAVLDDGTFFTYYENTTTAQELLDMGAVQAFSFGPILLEDSEIRVTPSDEVFQSMASNPRTAIGMISPLDYIIIVSDGRTKTNEGLSLYELAQVFKELGCKNAYNFDGGGSSTLWFSGKIINYPTNGTTAGEREVSDIVYIGY